MEQNRIVEIASPDNPSDNNPEEIFSRLTLPGISYSFAISREENFEGEFIYRMYNFDEKEYKRIEEPVYARLRNIMHDTALLFNREDFLRAQMLSNKLINAWRNGFDKNKNIKNM